MVNSNSIKITRSQIIETEVYKALSHIKKKLLLQRNNVLKIDHGFQVAKNVGLDVWLKQSNFGFTNIEIIKELLKLYKVES